MQIYEIDQAIANLIDAETGEIADLDTFLNLQMERGAKIENMALWVKDLNAEADAIKTEKNALAERETTARNKAERLKNYLLNILNGEKYSTARVAITYRKSSSVEVCESFVAWAKEHAPGLLRTKEPEPDKTAIKDALSSGSVIVGAEIVEKQSLQIK